MKTTSDDRRENPRFDVRLTLRYRLSQKDGDTRWNTGITRDMSKQGVSFKTRRPVPVGAHIELRIDWPALYDSRYPMELQTTGFVIRSDSQRTAVRITSHRFLIQTAETELSKTA